MVRTGQPQVPVEHTLDVIRTLIAGRRSMETGNSVDVDDIPI